MQPLSTANKLLPGILFLLLAVLAPPPPCIAVTIEEIYDDESGEGFEDGTALTQEEKTFLSARGNDAGTLGEARKKAFEHATSILAGRLAGANTIRVKAEFTIFVEQRDPDDDSRCAELTSGNYLIAAARPAGYGYPDDRFTEGTTSDPGLGTAYPFALFETLSGIGLNGEEADIHIEFSECIPFYYGTTGSAPADRVDFVQISLHEIMHGLGFLEHVTQDGSFSRRRITIKETRNGNTTERQAVIRSRTIFDEQLYSEADDDLFINLTNGERAAAITSGTGLLWEGTDNGENGCSYGRRMAELKSGNARSRDGKPRLHAPRTYSKGSSVTHTHANAEDIMESRFPFPGNMDLTLGMLEDMGWSVSGEGFPPGCEPTGIAVTPASGLVTTEAGGTAEFEVELESEPAENVTVSVRSARPAEGVVTDPRTSILTFTPSNWNVPKRVTVTGVDDTSQDGPQNYSVELNAESNDRFYAALAPKLVYLRNEDNEPPRQQPQPSQPPQQPRPSPSEPAVTVSFGSSSYGVIEGETAAVRVTLSGDPERAVTVPITADPTTTADAEEDYSLSSTSVTFASGETSKDITLTAADDDVDDDGEVVVLVFGTLPPRVSGGARTSATITIGDASPPPAPGATESGGGCALAAGADRQTENAWMNMLLIVAALFSIFSRKTDRPRYGGSL